MRMIDRYEPKSGLEEWDGGTTGFTDSVMHVQKALSRLGLWDLEL